MKRPRKTRFGLTFGARVLAALCLQLSLCIATDLVLAMSSDTWDGSETIKRDAYWEPEEYLIEVFVGLYKRFEVVSNYSRAGRARPILE